MPRRRKNLHSRIAKAQNLSVLHNFVDAGYSSQVRADNGAPGFPFQLSRAGGVIVMMMRNENCPEAQTIFLQNSQDRRTVARVNHKRIVPAIRIQVNQIIAKSANCDD